MKTFKIIATVIFLTIGYCAKSQDKISTLLAEIEKNNPEISAFKSQMDYESANVRSENLPSNPAVEFGRFPAVNGAGVKYAWGVTQHFDFPTVYSKRAKVASATDKLLEAEFNAARQEILLEAKQLIIEINFQNSMLKVYREREVFAKKMLSDYRKKLEVGDATALEYNNAILKSTDFSLIVKETENTLRMLNQKLVTLNGNNPIEVPEFEISSPALPDNDSIVNQAKLLDPRFTIAESIVQVAEKELVLVKHLGLPDIEIGYASEKTDTEHFAGFKAGLSIPLWANSNKRKAAKLNVSAAQSGKINYEVEIISEYEKSLIDAQGYYERIIQLKDAIEISSNIELLNKALELGHISSIDFYQEIVYYYELSNRISNLEVEYQKTIAALYRFNL